MSKKILIITDGTESINRIANLISGALTEHSVNICSAEKFEGTDLLPAAIFFIGCENPSPASFSYLEEMLKHINLASRKCGLFSVNDKTLTYLTDIVKDSDASIGSPLHVKNNDIPKPDLDKWIKGII